ncbi:hypothetical protein, partial [Pseudomonas aeruginosa]
MQELKQRLASPPAELTPAERKVVRALLDADLASFCGHL